MVPSSTCYVHDEQSVDTCCKGCQHKVCQNEQLLVSCQLRETMGISMTSECRKKNTGVRLQIYLWSCKIYGVQPSIKTNKITILDHALIHEMSHTQKKQKLCDLKPK